MIANEQETTGRGRKRWLRIKELPFSTKVYYQLRNNPEITTVTVKRPGGGKGIVLIDSDSLDRYFEKLAAKQAQEAR